MPVGHRVLAVLEPTPSPQYHAALYELKGKGLLKRKVRNLMTVNEHQCQGGKVGDIGIAEYIKYGGGAIWVFKPLDPDKIIVRSPV